MIGAGTPSLSSHRYSPYPIPSLNNAAAGQLGSAAAAVAAGGVQYSVASPLMSQLSTTTVLPSTAPSQQQQTLEGAVATQQAAQAAVQSHVSQTSQGLTQEIIKELNLR